jgi:hypothetical protein
MDGANSLFSLLINGEVYSAIATALIPANGVLTVFAGQFKRIRGVTRCIAAVWWSAVRHNALYELDDHRSLGAISLSSSEDMSMRFGSGMVAQQRRNSEHNYQKRFTRADLFNNRAAWGRRS